MYLRQKTPKFALPTLLLGVSISALCISLVKPAIASDLDRLVVAQTTTQPRKTAEPTFFEEERRLRTPTNSQESAERAKRGSEGFTEDFLLDALGGVSDQLTGSGFAGTTVDSLKSTTNRNGGELPPPSLGIFRSLPPGR
jgi:hypothetical protein